MEIKQGYAYHIKDEYFTMAKDEHLMKNKEDGNYRPTMYCIKDNKYDIYWMIPISSQYDKYADIKNQLLQKGKKCNGIVLGEFDGKKAAFLIQNMFPVTEKYIECKYIKNKVEITVSNRLQEEIIFKANKVLNLYKHGMKNIVFPNINNILKKLENS